MMIKNITLLLLMIGLLFNSSCKKSMCINDFQSGESQFLDVTKGSDFIIIKNKCSTPVTIKRVEWIRGNRYSGPRGQYDITISAWLTKKIYYKGIIPANDVLSKVTVSFTRWECEQYKYGADLGDTGTWEF